MEASDLFLASMAHVSNDLKKTKKKIHTKDFVKVKRETF